MENKEMKKASMTFYVVLFFMFFLIFSYLTFPYGILKEAISAKLSKESGYIIRMGQLEPDFPLGFEIKNLEVITDLDKPSLNINYLSIECDLLYLFLGKIGIEVSVEGKKGDYLGVNGRMPLWQLLAPNPIPTEINLEANSFEIANIMTFFLQIAASDPKNLMAGLLQKVGVVGQMDGSIDLELDQENLDASTGNMSLKLNNGALTVDEPALGLSKQEMKKALIQAKVEGGKFLIDNNSGFHTQDLLMDFSGSIQLKEPILRSGLDLQISVKLLENLKRQFGLFLDMAGGRNGKITVNLRGTLDRITKKIR